MSRWQPDAPGRLQEAAYELYTERGYDQTTVAEIAARAGLTERTFFRHFADKREVLFGGGDRFRDAVLAPVLAAPAAMATLDAVTEGIHAAGTVLPGRDLVRRRQALLLATPELHERELMKLAVLAGDLAQALRGRGVAEADAAIAAELALTVLRVALARWVDDPGGQSWGHHVDDAMRRVRRLAAEPTDPRGAAGAGPGASGSADAPPASRGGGLHAVTPR